MWIRKRLDISASDIMTGIRDCFVPGSSISVEEEILALLENRNKKAVICFSVRTGLDLLLQALNFEKGSEILMSALTIPDMPRIVRHHGYTPVPVDIDTDTLAPLPESMETAITKKTKAVIFAHLFGNISNLSDISNIARAHNLILIEDCAQSYHGWTYTGSDAADISLFSFGTIKTATALGGGILVIRNNNDLARKIHAIQTTYPVQKRWSYLKKLAKYLFWGLVYSPGIYRCVVTLLKKARIDYDEFIQNLSRSYPGEKLLGKIRYQPGFPLLKLMLRRFRTFSERRFLERVHRGSYLQEKLPQTCRFPGIESEKHTFWVFPVLHNHPDELIQDLRNSGFDATRKHSLSVIEPAENGPEGRAPNCDSIIRRIVYLPLYPQIPMAEIERMISRITPGNIPPKTRSGATDSPAQ